MDVFKKDDIVGDENPVDALPSKLIDIMEDNDDNKVKSSIKDLDEYLSYFKEELGKRTKHKLAKLVSKGKKIFLIKVEIPSGPMVSIKVFMIMEKLSDKGEIIGTIPDGESLTDGKFDNDLILLLAHADKECFKEIFNEVFNVEPEYDEVSSGSLDLEELEEISDIDNSEHDEIDSLINQVEELMLDENSVTINKEGLGDGTKQIDAIKVKVDNLNSLFQLIEELVLIRNQYVRVNDTKDYDKIKDINRNLDRTTNDLYNGVLRLRMVSVGQIFNHMKQYVSILSNETGKIIDFIIKGKDVEVDRNILEELVEPIKGLISNAVIHGIETPETRLEKGKHRVGSITINAENDDESIRITISDDGAGLCPESVKETALSLGLTSNKIVKGISSEEVFDLLSLPGFTMREYGDDLGSDAMGINAIKQIIESNSGTFKITGETDKGSTATVIIPTNLAIKRVLLFELGSEIYAIPASMVQMVTSIEDITIKSKIDDTSLFTYRDRVIPLYDLTSKIGINYEKKDNFGIIIEKRHRQCCVCVSRIIGFEEVVVKSAQEHAVNYRGIVGLTILSDGRATPILDLWSIIQE